MEEFDVQHKSNFRGATEVFNKPGVFKLKTLSSVQDFRSEYTNMNQRDKIQEIDDEARNV